MRAQWNTRVEKDVVDKFETKCKADGLPRADVLESLMRLYIEDQILIEKTVYIKATTVRGGSTKSTRPYDGGDQ